MGIFGSKDNEKIKLLVLAQNAVIKIINVKLAGLQGNMWMLRAFPHHLIFAPKALHSIFFFIKGCRFFPCSLWGFLNPNTQIYSYQFYWFFLKFLKLSLLEQFLHSQKILRMFHYVWKWVWIQWMLELGPFLNRFWLKKFFRSIGFASVS